MTRFQAMWLMPKNSVYGGWPTSGEIDLVEVRSNKKYTDENGIEQGIRRMGATMHFGPSPSQNQYHKTHWTRLAENGDYSDDFHTYGLEWLNSSMTFYVDYEPVGRIEPPPGGFWELGEFDKTPGAKNVWKNGGKMAPFDEEFYIILNVAVGGRFFPDKWKSNGEPRPYNFQNGSAKKQFWNARRKWMRTWDRPELLVDHILVYGWN